MFTEKLNFSINSSTVKAAIEKHSGLTWPQWLDQFGPPNLQSIDVEGTAQQWADLGFKIDADTRIFCTYSDGQEALRAALAKTWVSAVVAGVAVPEPAYLGYYVEEIKAALAAKKAAEETKIAAQEAAAIDSIKKGIVDLAAKVASAQNFVDLPKAQLPRRRYQDGAALLVRDGSNTYQTTDNWVQIVRLAKELGLESEAEIIQAKIEALTGLAAESEAAWGAWVDELDPDHVPAPCRDLLIAAQRTRAEKYPTGDSDPVAEFVWEYLTPYISEIQETDGVVTNANEVSIRTSPNARAFRVLDRLRDWVNLGEQTQPDTLPPGVKITVGPIQRVKTGRHGNRTGVQYRIEAAHYRQDCWYLVSEKRDDDEYEDD